MFPRSRDTVRPSSARWITDQLLVLGDPGPVTPAVAQVAEPGVVTVVVGMAAGWPGAVDAIAQQVPSGTPCLLLAAGAGTPTAAGAPTTLLARRLRSEVLAPVGTFHLVPGGTAFSPAGWVRVTPDGATTQHGTRYPAPWWGAALDELEHLTPPELRVTQLPAGAWVRPAEVYRPHIECSFFDTPLSHTRIQIVTDLPVPAEVERLLDKLPPEVHEHLVLVPHPGERSQDQVATHIEVKRPCRVP